MKMICVDGFKAFRGKLIVTPKHPEIQPFVMEGDWIYRPDTDCWYGCGRSFVSDICTPVTE